MADARTRPFRQIAAIRDAQRMAGELTLSVAEQARHQAGGAHAQAREMLGASRTAWQEHLASGGFIPEIASAHLAAIRQAAATEQSAMRDLTARSADRDRAAIALGMASANHRAAEKMAGKERRALALEAEERRLAELSDRISRKFGEQA